MKAEEFTAVLHALTQTITSIQFHDGWANDLTRLNKIWDKLNQHRLAMEAAERIPQCSTCGAAVHDEHESLCPACHEATQAGPDIPSIILDGRLERIEKRLGKIEEQAESANKQLAEHSHGRAVYVVNV